MARNTTFFNRAQLLQSPYDVAELVDNNEEANLIGAEDFSNLPPIGGAPNPVRQLEQPAPKLDDLGIAPVAPTAPAAPVAGSMLAPTTPEAMYATGYSQKSFDAANKRLENAMDRIVTEGGGSKEDRLVSTAPSWYKSGEPPKGHSTWANAMQALGGIAAAPAEQRLKDPRRSSALKQKDARDVAMARGLSGLFSHLFTRGSENFDRKQAAALKDAQMMRTLPGGKTGAQLEHDQAAAYLDRAQRQRQIDSLEKNRAFVQATEAAKHDPNSPEAQATARAIGEQAEGLTMAGIDKARGAITAAQSAEARARQEEANAANREREIMLKHEQEIDARLSKELAEAQDKRNSSQVPDMEWNANSPPTPERVKSAQQLWGFTKGMKGRLEKMDAVQQRIEQKAAEYAKAHGLDPTGGFAKLYAMGGDVHTWVSADPEMKQLTADANILQRAIQNYYRRPEYANTGVLQKWEDIMTKAQIPKAGGIAGLLRGPYMWKALHKDAEQMWVDGVVEHGGHLKGQPDPFADAITPEKRIEEREKTRKALPGRARVVKGKVETMPDVPTVPAGDKLPVTETKAPPIPDDARKPPAPKPEPLPAGKKRYKVTVKGKTSVQTRTPESIATLQELAKKPNSPYADLEVEELE